MEYKKLLSKRRFRFFKNREAVPSARENDNPFGFIKAFRCKLCARVYKAEDLNQEFPDVCFDPQCPGHGKTGKIEVFYVPGSPYKFIPAPEVNSLNLGKMITPDLKMNSRIDNTLWPSFTLFILWCAGVSKHEVDWLGTDKLKYQTQGIAILLAGILSSISGGYALYYVFYDMQNGFLRTICSVLFGLLWGSIILNVDRSVIIGFTAKSSVGKKVAVALPRLLLAVVISFVISVPIELQIFKGPIDSKVNEAKKRSLDQANLAVNGQISAYNDHIKSLRNDNENLNKVLLNQDFVKMEELKIHANGADGQGRKFNQRNAEEQTTKEEIQANNDSISLYLNKIGGLGKKTLSITQLGAVPEEALPNRIGYLDKISSDYNNANYWIKMMIQLLFIIVECFPVLLKLFQNSGPFDAFREYVNKESEQWISYAQKLNEEQREAWKRAEELRKTTEAEIYAEAILKYRSN